MEQTWSITFTNATAFTCFGDTVGSVGGGTITADFSPANAAYSKPFFTLSSSSWGGSWAAGDVLTFRTHPAAVPIWEVRVIPANSGSLSGDFVDFGIYGESE
ncbi:MAG: hypothetical protein HQL74_16220 [Magnetococcales bacterium]|nr:hypothetical protein [Magnetococcales bacterium]